MVRRAGSAVILAALVAAGAASATMLGSGGSSVLSSQAGQGACGATTTPFAAASSSEASTTTTTVSGPGVGTAATTAAAAPGATVPASSVPETPTPVAAAGCGVTSAPAAPPGGGAANSTGAAAGNDSASTLVLSGHGWGHGLGMSQWGAYGYATHGWSDSRILQHYYPGTSLGVDPSPTVRVLLASGRRRVSLGSASAWRIVDAGRALTLPAGEAVVPASLLLAGHRLVSPLTVEPGASPLELGGRPYRGRLLVVSNGTRLEVVDLVGMESYLDGVVGSEMPASWPAAALEAQAIAARSYALARLGDSASANPYDLYADSRSQIYGGIVDESPAVSAAVAATAHQVVTYHGQVATTYYSSSSGGETVSAAEALGTPVPYLVSVADPYDTLSPFHDWGPVLLGTVSAGKALGLVGPLLDLQTISGPSRHVETATAVGAAGQLTLAGTQVEADLGLRSTWFAVGWLALSAPAAPIRAGASVTLSGVARGVTGVGLESQSAGGSWRQLGPIDPGPDGAFTTSVSPLQTTRYRLALGTLAAAGAVTVPVAGSEAPAVAGGAGTGPTDTTPTLSRALQP